MLAGTQLFLAIAPGVTVNGPWRRRRRGVRSELVGDGRILAGGNGQSGRVRDHVGQVDEAASVGGRVERATARQHRRGRQRDVLREIHRDVVRRRTAEDVVGHRDAARALGVVGSGDGGIPQRQDGERRAADGDLLDDEIAGDLIAGSDVGRADDAALRRRVGRHRKYDDRAASGVGRHRQCLDERLRRVGGNNRERSLDDVEFHRPTRDSGTAVAGDLDRGRAGTSGAKGGRRHRARRVRVGGDGDAARQ